MNPTPPNSDRPDPDRTEPIVLDGAGGLIGSLPYLFGFHPTDSLVAIPVDDPGEGSNDRLSVDGAARVDLPDPHHYQAAAATLAGPLLGRGVRHVYLVVITASDIPDGPPTMGADLPARGLVDECRAVFAAVGILIEDTWWTAATTAGASWRCYHDPDHHGSVPDLAISTLAAQAVLSGQVTYGNRDEMTDTLAPDPDDVLVRRAALLASLAERHQPHRSDRYRRFHQLGVAIREAASGTMPSSDEQLMRLVLALRDHVVRDACLAYTDGELRDGAEQLWRHLVRGTPGPDRAESAVLLALTTFGRHDAITAGMALACGHAANPEHRLINLLIESMAQGIASDDLWPTVNRISMTALDEVMKSNR